MEELERKTEEKMIQKKELRRKIKEKISFTTEKYRKEADRKITESVLELNEYKSADCVFCYVSTEKEMDTFSILQDILQSGKHLGVPKCTEKGIMNVYEIHWSTIKSFTAYETARNNCCWSASLIVLRNKTFT